MAYVQTLQFKIDSLESSIKDTVSSTVTSAVGTATGSITSALKAAMDGINTLTGKTEKDIDLAVGKKIDATRKEFQAQLDAFHSRVGEVETRQDKTDEAIAAMAEQIKALQDALAVADKQPVQKQFISRDFDRAADHTIIKVHADGLATLAEATKALSKWIIDSDVKETDFKVQGDATSRYFTVQFTGLPGTAANRVQKVLDGMRGRDGNWTRIYAPAVAGAGMVELRAGPDKSPKQIKTEIVGKRIRQALERELPSHTWRVDRTKGWIMANWTPVLAYVVRPGRDEAPVLTFQDTGLPALGIDRAQLKAAASAAVAPAEAPQFWL